MSQQIVLSRAAFEALLASLTNLEEAKEKLLDDFFPVPSRERDVMIGVLEDYTRRVGETLRTVTVSEDGPDRFPYVVIGSRVCVQEPGTAALYTYRLIGPFHTEVGFEDVSFLSPMGRALLLREVEDTVTVKAPGGTFSYRICSITLPG